MVTCNRIRNNFWSLNKCLNEHNRWGAGCNESRMSGVSWGKAGDYFKGLPIRTRRTKSVKGTGSLCRAGISVRVQEYRAGLQITDSQLGKGVEQPL